MTHSPLIDGVALTSDSDSRNGRKVSRFIVHHAATTSLSALLADFAPGGREVSANYALGPNGELILTVDEDRSAWTSASWFDDIAVTIEVCNSQAGGTWPFSDKTFDKLARLIADVSLRYGFPINDDTVLTHQELWIRYGESYPTACPGDLQRRKPELLDLANKYRSGGTVERTDDDEMISADTQAWLNQSLNNMYNALVKVVQRENRGRLFFCPNPPQGLPRFVIIFEDRNPGEHNVMYVWPTDGLSDEQRARNLNSTYGQTADTVEQAKAYPDAPSTFQTRINLALGQDAVFTNQPPTA